MRSRGGWGEGLVSGRKSAQISEDIPIVRKAWAVWAYRLGNGSAQENQL